MLLPRYSPFKIKYKYLPVAYVVYKYGSFQPSLDPRNIWLDSNFKTSSLQNLQIYRSKIQIRCTKKIIADPQQSFANLSNKIWPFLPYKSFLEQCAFWEKNYQYRTLQRIRKSKQFRIRFRIILES